MTDITVIILVGNEERHIKRCLEKLAPLEPRQVFVVESQKGDRTHEVAIETAKELGWNSALQLQLPTATKSDNSTVQPPTSKLQPKQQRTLLCDRRAMAEKKVAEWLTDVDDETFEVALQKLVEEKTAAGEYRFNRAEDRELATQGARRFFADFASKIVSLSDGRCVYFVPDPRAVERNASNALSWAEYAFHAVSAGGAKVPGQNYNERWYNPHKVRNLRYLEEALRAERCFVRLSKVDCRYDSVMFAGESHDGEAVQVVTRLDEMGNMDANLSEVTFNATRRQEKKLPRFVPLTEAVRTVVHHQNTAGSYPSNEDNIANPPSPRKGGGEVVSGQRLGVSNDGGARTVRTGIHLLERDEDVASTMCREHERGFEITSTNNSQLTVLHLVWHDWPGNQAAQFNWALDALCASEKGKVKSEKRSEWILRLDADEYLTDPLIARIKAFVTESPKDVDLVSLRLGRTWQGKRVRFGTPPKYIPRLFRVGACRYGDQVMDERLEADPARTIRFAEEFVDDNLNSFDWWREKHIGYMKREAQKAVGGAHGNKGLYYKMPPYLRAIGYWALRYFVFLGFLDGRAGWSWNFWQGLWYRWQVDREISRLRGGSV